MKAQYYNVAKRREKKENAGSIGVSKLFTTKEKAQGTNNENGKSVMTTPVLLKKKNNSYKPYRQNKKRKRNRSGIRTYQETVKEREEAYTILLNESNQLSEKKWEVEAELRKTQIRIGAAEETAERNGNIAWNVKQEHKL